METSLFKSWLYVPLNCIIVIITFNTFVIVMLHAQSAGAGSAECEWGLRGSGGQPPEVGAAQAGRQEDSLAGVLSLHTPTHPTLAKLTCRRF